MDVPENVDFGTDSPDFFKEVRAAKTGGKVKVVSWGCVGD